jgi:hypothetical protein
MKLSKEKMSESHWYKIGKFILTSAPFAMLLSIVFFWYEMHRNDKESDEMIGNLKQIEQSLSTRHIGIFPAYLDEINKLLSETPKDAAKIIIFEDVLFYGAFYNGSSFKKMIQQLADLSNKGKKIVIAYYDNSKEWRKGRMFREVVQESWMWQSDLSKLAQERSEVMDSLQKNLKGRENLLFSDSIVSEKYFTLYRDDKRKEFSERRKKILVPFYDASGNDNLLFKRLDDIKNSCLGKPENSITFYDIYTMYNQVTEELKAFFYQHNIITVPLNNYLTMSCWSNGEKVLFAFPGRFAADEIGFISHDLAILRYIETMLAGILNNN